MACKGDCEERLIVANECLSTWNMTTVSTRKMFNIIIMNTKYSSIASKVDLIEIIFLRIF